jgi:hypothetical protein
MIFAVIILLIVVGVVPHGISGGVWDRFFHDLIGRPDGPMRFRFILQPVMAAVAAVRDGRADSMAGHAPFLWTVMSKPEQRAARLREALNATARVILLGVVMDAIYQVLVLKMFYPAEAAVIALVLAFSIRDRAGAGPASGSGPRVRTRGAVKARLMNHQQKGTEHG